MTRPTTDAKYVKRSDTDASRRFWLVLLVGSMVVHLGLWFALQAWGETELGATDLPDNKALAEEVKQREEQRRERERELRQKIELDEEAARQLQEQIEAQKRRDAKEELARLERTRAEIEQMRDEAFKKLKERRQREIALADLPEIDEVLDKVDFRVQALSKRNDSGTNENEKINDAKTAVDRAADNLREKPEQASKHAKDLADALSELDKQLGVSKQGSNQRNDEDRSDAVTRAEKPTNEAQDLVDKLAGKLSDIEAFNSTKTAQSLPPSNEPTVNEPSDNKTPEPTETATTGSPAPAEGGKPESLAETYAKAREQETKTRKAFADLRTAQLATRQNSSFKSAQKQVGSAAIPSREDLTGSLNKGTPNTVGELNEFRETVSKAEGQIQDMSTRSQSLLAQAKGQPMALSNKLRSALAGDPSGSGVMSLGQNTGNGFNEGLDRGTDQAVISPGSNAEDTINLATAQIIREALPGRMFTRVSDRKGWLYLDTWYTIGPWENDGRPNFEIAHLPEVEIDLDAKYIDGKYADRTGHPDQVLSWNFVQSDEVRIQPHRTHSGSTYYAYTEVYFDEPREMILAFGADAAGRIWINDELQWEDNVRSLWRLIEGTKTVRFKQGYNRILVRLMNGSGEAAFSVLLCPPEAAQGLKNQ